MTLDFEQGTALVAGGSGGIGAAVVERLVRSGLKVAFTYHSGETRARELESRLGASARAYHWSGEDFASSSELLRRVAAEHGRVRALVAAGGIAQEKALYRLEEAEARRLVDTNLTAVVGLVRAAVAPMMKSGGGRIVLVSSVSGSRGIAGHTVYAATKAGLEGFTRSLAQEVASFGVTVNCVAPGFVDTPMLGDVPDRVREAWIARIPLGRLAKADEIADVVAFVLSKQAAYVTGQSLVVDGGISL